MTQTMERIGPTFIAFLIALSAIPAVAEFDSVTIISQPVASSRQFDGRVEAIHQATVSAQTSARIAEVLFDVGDQVAAGAVILRMVSEDQQAGLQQAQANLAEANAALEVGQLELARVQALFQKGMIAKAQLEQAQGTMKRQQAQVNNAQGALLRAKQQLDYTVVKAPFGGVVSQRHVELGEAVTVGSPLMSGFKADALRVVVDIPQDLAALARNQPQVHIQTGPDYIKPIHILVYPTANSVSGTTKVRLELPAGTHNLTPGQWIKVRFQTGEEMKLIIPQTAVIQRSQVSGVYVKTQQGIQLRQVRLGQHHANGVEINAGLSDGDVLILNPIQVILQKSADQGQPHE